ncbi:hypothetical protein TSAR_002625 [Trichomalopsis sarcophagae]|uniref:Uncharacterized protein n=1 Tax=Trichomalopsis sarcophagae TaxID=543379 RepID=A0A232EUY3_9HYME|nr:hypothetical protein TSAR_002625 [Trichomalopsis sarcophagae]
MSVYSLDSLENERTPTLKIPDTLELCAGAEASGSPEAAGLSICGDSSSRLLDAGAEENVSRDDRSELSFYRRLLDEAEAEAYQRRTSRDATCFRPYTIEDYRIIRATSAKLDRSLGPDRDDVCAKSVATAQGPQSRRALEITEEPSSSFDVSKPAAIPSCRLNRQVVKRSCSTGTGPPRRCNQSANASSITRTRLQPGKSKEGGKVEASLQALRTRHFNEKRMIDQLVARAMLLRA